MESIHVPVWMVGVIWALLLALIGYVWNRLESRVKKIEKGEEDIMKARAAEGPVLTVATHEKICVEIAKMRTDIVKGMLVDLEIKMSMRMDLLEKNILLTIENAILKSGVQGRHQGIYSRSTKK